MKHNNQSGNAWFYILLTILIIVIGVLVYILAGGPMPRTGDTVGTKSPTMQVETMPETSGEFTDGLNNPESSETFQLDEFGAGIAERDIFRVDINADNQPDRITRTRHENGTAHFYYEYTIEIADNGQFINITPNGFRTTEGPECALQKLQFTNSPKFRVVKISRNWRDTWETPTTATRTVYEYQDGKIVPTAQTEMEPVCDVRELFN